MLNRKAGRWIMELTDMERQRSALVSVTASLRRRGSEVNITRQLPLWCCVLRTYVAAGKRHAQRAREPVDYSKCACQP